MLVSITLPLQGATPGNIGGVGRSTVLERSFRLVRLVVGDQTAPIRGTVHYNGYWNVLAVTPTTIEIDAVYIGPESSGSACCSIVTGWHHAYYHGRHTICADRVNAGTFYIYNSLGAVQGGGVYRSNRSRGHVDTPIRRQARRNERRERQTSLRSKSDRKC